MLFLVMPGRMVPFIAGVDITLPWGFSNAMSERILNFSGLGKEQADEEKDKRPTWLSQQNENFVEN